eukprot:c7380_g2_i1 orf=1581-1802(+)
MQIQLNQFDVYKASLLPRGNMHNFGACKTALGSFQLIACTCSMWQKSMQCQMLASCPDSDAWRDCFQSGHCSF